MSSDDEDGSDDDSVLRAFLNNFGGNIADLDDPLHEEVAEVEAAEDGATDYAPSPKRQRGRPKGKSASEWGIVVHHASSKPAAKLWRQSQPFVLKAAVNNRYRTLWQCVTHADCPGQMEKIF